MTSHTTTPARANTARAQLHAYLTALSCGALLGSLFELRERHGQLMRRRFIPTAYPDQAVSAILRATRERDVYLGAAPRARRHGSRDAIPFLTTLWVDAGTPDAIARLPAFTPAPSILIATGRGRHAYWLLERPVDVDAGERANQRLAHHLAADTGCFDAPRILRPPHTTNYGYQPARPVRLLRLAADERRPLEQVLADVPELSERDASRPLPQTPALARSNAGDPLLEFDPADYVSALLGAPVGRDRKVSCPFHTDARPSLHVYPTAAQGWHCFSCRRGGTVYDLASELWGLQPRGVEFLRLRALLRERLLGNTP